ncbi:MAG: cyclic nucleotide-binding domain-containing protein [Thiobacillus sp.]|nr:cyclic nucleotide-binding domain-containing protein [Thiobacillus sp.]
MTPYTPDSFRDVLTQLPLFSELSTDEVSMLLPGVREYKARASEMLFNKGDRLDGIYVVVTGQVKLSIPTQHGLEKVIGTMNAGAAFAEAIVFLDIPCPVSAQATQDSVLLVASKKVLLEVLDHDPRFARKMLASLSMKLHQLMADMETCTLMNSVQRVVCFLSHQAPEKYAAQYEVKLDTSKQMLASRLSLAPETLSRVLHHLVTAGLIEVKGRTLRILDAQRLKAFQG